jgi:phosphoribosylglycinamide formyltransferase-1
MDFRRITVLVSGRGSNLAALADASTRPGFAGTITHVISNRPQAGGLAIACERGIPATVVDHTAFATREAFDASLAEAVDGGAPDLVVLAGFMRVLTDAFVARYAGRLLNIHPSLLPAYPGLHTHRRALADGVKVHGCTVHFVTPAVDVGPIVAQAAVPVHPDDDEAALAARVLVQEHRLLPAVVRWFCAGRIVLAGGRARVRDAPMPAGALMCPAADPI